MELKTLKDLEFWNTRTLSKMRMQKELKAEAVKCLSLEEIRFIKVLSEVKRIELDKLKLDNPLTKDFSFKVTAEVKRFICWFFNLTEDDLQ